MAAPTAATIDVTVTTSSKEAREELTRATGQQEWIRNDGWNFFLVITRPVLRPRTDSFTETP
jgi:hypothetical protein